MSTKYEDNFGFYCLDDNDPEELEFFCHIRAQSEPTICVRCNQKVRLLKYVTLWQPVHKLLNMARRQIQLGSFLVFGQQ
jgi:hypothetical protein